MYVRSGVRDSRNSERGHPCEDQLVLHRPVRLDARRHALGEPGFVGPGRRIGRASNSAKNADTHLIIPTGVVQTLPTLLEAQDGQILPFDSTSLGGDDAFTLWTQR